MSPRSEAAMAELTLAYKTRTYSTSAHGRAIVNARNHHLVADDSGGEAITAGELFMGGIGACAVNLVQRIAKGENIPANRMEATVSAYRDPARPQGQVSVFDKVDVHFEFWDIKDAQAVHLVDVWKRR